MNFIFAETFKRIIVVLLVIAIIMLLLLLLLLVLVLFLLSISFAFLGCFQLLNYINSIVGPIVYHNGNDMHKYKLKQQFSYTSAYMLGGWTLTCCETGEDNMLYKLVS